MIPDTDSWSQRLQDRTGQERTGSVKEANKQEGAGDGDQVLPHHHHSAACCSYLSSTERERERDEHFDLWTTLLAFLHDSAHSECSESESEGVHDLQGLYAEVSFMQRFSLF